MCAVKVLTSTENRGHEPPGKFQKTWIVLDFISSVFMVERDNIE